jgi:hypothetical protein
MASIAVLIPFLTSGESVGAELVVVDEVDVLPEVDTVVIVVVPDAAAIPRTFSIDGPRSFPSDVRLLPTDSEAASSSDESVDCVIATRVFE